MSDLEDLRSILTVGHLSEAAGSTYFQRGEDYFEAGLVRNLRFGEDELHAVVEGSKRYHTMLYELEGELAGECDCPLGRRDEFCKHMVATGLAWINGEEETRSEKPAKKKGRSDADILKAWLSKQKKAELIELVWDQCVEDADFCDRLLVKAAADRPTDLSELKRMIQQSYRINGFVDWHHTRNYYYKLDQVGDTLRNLLDRGKAEAVIDLTEYAMKRWETAINHIDDSDGGMGSARDELHQLHYEACKLAMPDPARLAERLFKTGLGSDWEMFYSAYESYESVWGEEGRARYRKLVMAEWNKLPRLNPGDPDPHRYGRAWWLSNLMTKFAQEDDDFERELEIHQRDLSNYSRFSVLASRCQEVKQLDRAVEWLEQGRKNFKDNWQLEEQCAELYWKQRRYDEALALYWKLFERQQMLQNYKTLVEYAQKHKVLDEWRDKAFAAIRVDITARKKKSVRSYWMVPDHSLLVEIFLWEGDVEQAWKEAQDGGCSEGLWMRLCKKREQDHPQEVFPVYLRLANEQVEHRNNDAYHEAVKKIKTAKALAERCGESALFESSLQAIRKTHKPKRNFMKYLDQAGL